jgi:bacterioferritin
MHNEKGHMDFLETQLDLIRKRGLERYVQHHIGDLSKDKCRCTVGRISS